MGEGIVLEPNMDPSQIIFSQHFDSMMQIKNPDLSLNDKYLTETKRRVQGTPEYSIVEPFEIPLPGEDLRQKENDHKCESCLGFHK